MTDTGFVPKSTWTDKGIEGIVEEARSIESLVMRARSVAQMAYSPYSGIKVGCIIVDETGREYFGTNVENSSYGLTICAERSAICQMVSSLYPLTKLRKVVVYSNKKMLPCGACLQVISEFGDPQIIVAHKNGWETLKLSDLLPRAFKL
jgi:cytidine deaminase